MHVIASSVVLVVRYQTLKMRDLGFNPHASLASLLIFLISLNHKLKGLNKREDQALRMLVVGLKTVVDLHSKIFGHVSTLCQNFLHFHAVFGKFFGQIIVWRPDMEILDPPLYNKKSFFFQLM